jgi:hypothetical protein
MVALAGLVSFALVVVGCGGSGSTGKNVAQLGSTATLSTTSSQAAPRQQASALAFSHCMRSHDVLSFPDPNASGAIPKVSLQQLGVSSSQFQAAQRTCQRLLPNSSQSSSSQVHEVMTALSKFARCVRSQGVPNWPDPLAESDAGEPGTPGFPRNMPGVNQDSPQVMNALSKCQHLLASIGYGSGGYP